MADIIESINNFVIHANEGVLRCKLNQARVKVSDDSTSVEFSAAEVRNELPRLPEVFFQLEVTYHCFWDENVPISDLNLTLGDRDYQRTLVVRGSQPDQVEALASMVVSKLTPYSTLLTGPGLEAR